MQPSWQPANEIEQAMSDALARGDQRAYFTVLTTADLLLPMPEPVDGDRGTRMATWTGHGRTFLLAFTSETALRSVYGDQISHCVRVNYTELAARWPDPQWWIAIDPGLPIDGFFPPGAVPDALSGEFRVPTVWEVAAGSENGGLAEFQPANALEEQLRSAIVEGRTDDIYPILEGGELMVPVTRDTQGLLSPSSPAFPWRLLEVDDVTAIPAFTCVARVPDTLRTPPPVAVSFPQLLACWPNLAYQLVINPGSPLGTVLTGEEIRTLLATDDPAD